MSCPICQRQSFSSTKCPVWEKQRTFRFSVFEWKLLCESIVTSQLIHPDSILERRPDRAVCGCDFWLLCFPVCNFTCGVVPCGGIESQDIYYAIDTGKLKHLFKPSVSVVKIESVARNSTSWLDTCPWVTGTIRTLGGVYQLKRNFLSRSALDSWCKDSCLSQRRSGVNEFMSNCFMTFVHLYCTCLFRSLVIHQSVFGLCSLEFFAFLSILTQLLTI